MQTKTHFDTDVLIVGAGPTGLTLACGLRRLGIACIIIDKEPPVKNARAMGLSSRSLEVLRALGVANEVTKEAVVYRTMDIYLKRRHALRMTFDVSEYASPFPFGSVLPQNRVVAIMETRLNELGTVVERPQELETLTQDNDGVTALVRNGEKSREIRARYVVGCDGAHSKVRTSLGLDFDGSDYEDRLLAADVFVDWDLSNNGGHIFLGSSGTITAFPFPETGKWRLAVFGGNVGTNHNTAAIMNRLRELMNECGPRGTVVRDPVHTTFYGIHRRFVRNFRLNRCFVAGDAAHIHSPAGGQGMNTGIQDSFNLAWKLALVLKGNASDSLLTSYSDERHAVAADILKITDRLTQIILPRGVIRMAIRNLAVRSLGHVGRVGRGVGRTLSQLGIGYQSSAMSLEGNHQGLSAAHRKAFKNSPTAGERAPDCAVSARKEAPLGRFFDSLYRDDTRHTLLLFDGLEPSKTDALIPEVARIVRQTFSDQLVIYRVPWPGFREISSHDLPLLLDADGSIHRAYGAVGACLYLIRPDGYIGFRSQPPDAEGLVSYLKKLFPH